MPTITADALTDFSTKLFIAGGASPDEAAIIAKSLVESNLRGHDSHGVMRIPFYIGKAQDGGMKPGMTLKIERETPAALVADGQWGFGQTLSMDMTRRLIEKARTVGIACGTLKRAAHIGRLGEYAEMAADAGLASIICANSHGSGQRVAPVGGKRGRLGTNPLCVGMPGGREGPFILDFGTSATAEGKVRVKKIAGQPVPLGWILDCDGNPTTDPNKLYADPPGSILPMGGDQAYKGFGLAYMIEMLCGGFSGGNCVFPNAPPPMGNCVMFILLDPQLFAGFEHLKKEALQLEEFVRGTPRVESCDKITLPGDPERNVMRKRRAEGIPLDDGNWNALVKLASDLKVPVPTVA